MLLTDVQFFTSSIVKLVRASNGTDFESENNYPEANIKDLVLIKDQEEINQNGIYRIVSLDPFLLSPALQMTIQGQDFQVRNGGTLWKLIKHSGVGVTFEEVKSRNPEDFNISVDQNLAAINNKLNEILAAIMPSSNNPNSVDYSSIIVANGSVPNSPLLGLRSSRVGSVRKDIGKYEFNANPATSFANLREELLSVKKNLDALTVLLGEKSSLINSVDTRIEDQKNAINDLQKKIDELLLVNQDQKDSFLLVDTLAKRVEVLELKSQEVLNLDEVKRNLETVVGAATNTANVLAGTQSNLAETKADLEGVKSGLEGTQTSLAVTNNSLVEAILSLSETKTSLTRIDTDLSETKTSLTETKVSFEGFNLKFSEIQKGFDDFKAILNLHNTDLAGNKESLNVFNAGLNDVVSKTNSVSEVIVDLSTKFSQNSDRLNSTFEDIQKVELANDNLLERLNSLTKKEDQLETLVNGLVVSVGELIARPELTSELFALQNGFSVLEDKNKVLEDKVLASETKVQDLETKNSGLENKVLSLETKNQTLEETLKTSDPKIETLENKSKDLEIKSQILETNVATLSNTLRALLGQYYTMIPKVENNEKTITALTQRMGAYDDAHGNLNSNMAFLNSFANSITSAVNSTPIGVNTTGVSTPIAVASPLPTRAIVPVEAPQDTSSSKLLDGFAQKLTTGLSVAGNVLPMVGQVLPPILGVLEGALGSPVGPINGVLAPVLVSIDPIVFPITTGVQETVIGLEGPIETTLPGVDV